MLIEVDQDCIRMSKYIEENLNCKFENGKAFYEATKKREDLLHCKKVLRPQTEEVISYLYNYPLEH